MRFRTIIISMCICLSFSSCIREEAANAEADIESCTVSDPSVLKMPPIIYNNTIFIMAQSTIDITHFSPQFTLTEGAIIEPASGTARDFSTPQTYTVTSQDRQWKKTYTVFVDISDVKLDFNFEHWDIVAGARGKQWHEFYEISTSGQRQSIWATANAGYALTGYVTPEGEKLTNALIYPTVSIDDVYEGGNSVKAVKLETKPTGAFGDMVNMPLAAGNLFLGSFDASVAGQGPKEALAATKFGISMAYHRKPIEFKVWYKYTPGPVFTDENKNPVENETDKFDAYAIIYEPVDNKPLDGSIQFDDDCITAIARVNDPQPSDIYKELTIPFEYKKEINWDKLSKGKYYTAIVFSSSRAGAYFRGAIGSTLIIDKAEIILEGDN